jgi:hypothetical protein
LFILWRGCFRKTLVYREELRKYFGCHDLFVLWRVVLQEDAVYREELIKYFGWHDLFDLWAWLLQEDAGVLGGVDKILWLA